MVAHNPQKQQQVAPSGLHAGITVIRAAVRAASGDPKKAEFIPLNSALALSALHPELVLGVTAVLFMGLLLEVKKIAGLLPLRSAPVVMYAAMPATPPFLEN